jgi:carboxylesterase type B
MSWSSTAFQWAYDRKGALDETFKRFAKKVNCGSSGTLECLRKVSTADLGEANQNEISEQLELGLFPFGPAVDGDLVPELPANLLKQG